MKLIIKDNDKAESFINIFQNIKIFTEVFTLRLREDAVYIQGMDSNHVSIFEILLSKEWFSEFDFTQSETIGINSNIFPKLLNTWTPDHSIVIDYDGNDKLEIAFEKVSGNSEYNKYFEMPLIEFEDEMMDIPEQEYTMDLEFDSRKLKKIIDELMLMGESVNIQGNEKEVNVTTTSVEGTMKINIPFDDIEAFSIEEDKTIDMQLSLRFIRNMCLFNKISPSLSLHLSEQTPMQLKYTMDDSSYVRFYLAPQVDE